MQYLKEILFIDIETVPVEPDYGLLTKGLQSEWIRKAKLIKTTPDANTDPALLFSDKAGVYSEFAKVVCIGFGSLHLQENAWKMRLKALTGENEKILLNSFCEILAKFKTLHKEIRFCGHNIKEFDIPFLCRRMIINNIRLPECMDVAGKKPWEVSHLDTMELWRFGDHKNFTPLSLLAEVLGIPSPKSDLDGSMVGSVYWNDKDLPRIGAYCLQDVLTTAKVFLRLKGLGEMAIDPVFVNE